jgi:hypothetical protein
MLADKHGENNQGLDRVFRSGPFVSYLFPSSKPATKSVFTKAEKPSMLIL